MSNSFMERFHRGEMNPMELENDEPRTAEFRDTERSIEAECKYFREILREEDKQRFDDMTDLYTDSKRLYGRHKFAFGFRLAFGLWMDALGGPTDRND